MDFRLGEKSDEFRDEVRAFLAEHITSEVIDEMHTTGTMHNWPMYRALAERGWMAGAWGDALGAQARDPFEMAAFFEELGYQDAPFIGIINSVLVAATVLHIGTPEQKEIVIPRVLAGESVLGLGYTEPDAGSDVAAAVTSARRDGDEWVIDGQKVFTTLAEVASHVLLLTRSDTTVKKHAGLTMFLLPIDTPGVEVQAIATMSGERTNMLFLSEVRLSDMWRIGEVHGGWDALRVALSLERGVFGPPAEGSRLLEKAVEWASLENRDGERPIETDHVRERLVNAAIDNEVTKLLAYRTVAVNASGDLPGVEGAMTKLYSSEALRRAATEFIDMLGAEGLLAGQVEGAPADGWIEHEYRHAVATTIYGGTSEILRSVIAERHLGLPRSRG